MEEEDEQEKEEGKAVKREGRVKGAGEKEDEREE